MKNIPVRIKAFFSKNNIKCNKCKHVFSVEDLKAISIRNSFVNKKKEVLSVEVFCPGCKNITFFELIEMNLIDFSLEVLSEIDNEKRAKTLDKYIDEAEEGDLYEEFDDEELDEEEFADDDESGFYKDEEDFDDDEKPFSSFKKENQSKNKNNKQKSKITLKEIKENIDSLNKIESHRDFLEDLGFSPDSFKK